MIKSHIWLLEYFWLTNIRNKDYKNWWKWLKAGETTPYSFSHYLQPLLCDQNLSFSTAAACSSWSSGIFYQPQLGALSAWAKQLQSGDRFHYYGQKPQRWVFLQGPEPTTFWVGSHGSHWRDSCLSSELNPNQLEWREHLWKTKADFLTYSNI